MNNTTNLNFVVDANDNFNQNNDVIFFDTSKKYYVLV